MRIAQSLPRGIDITFSRLSSCFALPRCSRSPHGKFILQSTTAINYVACVVMISTSGGAGD